MANKPKQTIPVTAAMKKAGATAIAGAPELPLEELATLVYRAMVEAEPGIPVLGTSPVQDEVAAASVLDGGGDKRKR